MVPKWRVIDRGRVPHVGASMLCYACPACSAEAELPVLGLALAQVGQAVVFDIGTHAMPRQIQCRFCRRRFQLDDEAA